MITEDLASQQVDRLRGLPFFPPAEAARAIAELVKAVSFADTPELAERAVSDLLRDEMERCPTPGRLRRVIEEANVADRFAHTRWSKVRCHQCNDTGFVVQPAWYLFEGRRIETSAAHRCACREVVAATA